MIVDLTEKFKPDRIVLSLQIEKTADKMEKIVDYLTENPVAKVADISLYINTSERRTREILKIMVENGVVEVEGNNKNRVYMLKR